MVLSVCFFTSLGIMFKWWGFQKPRKPRHNYTIKSFLFVSIDAYAHGWVLALKVLCSLGTLGGAFLLVLGCVALYF
jgi:hypothetical protein